MGKGRALSDGVIKKILLSYTYVAIWIFLSFTVIVYNKYILDKKLYNWPYPITLTMIHMAFCSSLAIILIKLFKIVDPVSMSRDTYLRSVVPIGALYSLSLWLSNSAYIYLSISFIQMLKALMPVAVYSIGVLLKKEAFKSRTMTNMLSISFGVAVAVAFMAIPYPIGFGYLSFLALISAVAAIVYLTDVRPAVAPYSRRCGPRGPGGSSRGSW